MRTFVIAVCLVVLASCASQDLKPQAAKSQRVESQVKQGYDVPGACEQCLEGGQCLSVFKDQEGNENLCVFHCKEGLTYFDYCVPVAEEEKPQEWDI